MKILIFSWRGPGHPLEGGAEIATFEFAKAWVKAGFEVTVFSSSFWGNTKKNEVVDGVKIIRMSNQILGVHISAVIWYLFGKHPHYDLVVDQFHGIPFFIPLFVWVKKIAFIHEIAKEVWWLNPLPKPLNWIIGFIGYICEPFIFLLYKNIPFITVSESTKKDLIKTSIPASNISIVYVGAKLSRHKKIWSSKTVITFLGAVTEDKGIEDALKAFKLIAKKIDAIFWIIGKGKPDYIKQLKQLGYSLGIGEKMHFFGFVSDDKKFKLLSKTTVILNPSIREGWGIVVIEAASVGAPTIAYKVPGLQDSIRDGVTGILCKKKSYEELALQAISLIKDQKRYKLLSKNSIKWSKNFTWEKAQKRSLKIVKKVLAQ